MTITTMPPTDYISPYGRAPAPLDATVTAPSNIGPQQPFNYLQPPTNLGNLPIPYVTPGQPIDTVPGSPLMLRVRVTSSDGTQTSTFTALSSDLPGITAAWQRKGYTVTTY